MPKRTQLIVLDRMPHIQDGIYDARWSGYVLRINVNGSEHSFTTIDGVRGLDCPVKVCVRKGWIYQIEGEQ